jgi:hypothetical protein
MDRLERAGRPEAADYPRGAGRGKHNLSPHPASKPLPFGSARSALPAGRTLLTCGGRFSLARARDLGQIRPGASAKGKGRRRVKMNEKSVDVSPWRFCVAPMMDGTGSRKNVNYFNKLSRLNRSMS